jgi:hypothetical protein
MPIRHSPYPNLSPSTYLSFLTSFIAAHELSQAEVKAKRQGEPAKCAHGD